MGDLEQELSASGTVSTVYLISSMLKLFLREMKGGLMPSSVCQMLQQTLCLQNQLGADVPDATWSKCFQHVSQVRISIITALFFFLHEVSRHSDINKMNASSLAVCFAPSIFEDMKN